MRTLLLQRMNALFEDIDVFLAPSNSDSVTMSNLTGHPAVVLPAGFVDDMPVGLMLTGKLWDEATLLRAAAAPEDPRHCQSERAPSAPFFFARSVAGRSRLIRSTIGSLRTRAAGFDVSPFAALAPQLFPPAFRNGDGSVAVYFEAAAVVLTLIMLGKYLEARAKQGASAALARTVGASPWRRTWRSRSRWERTGRSWC